MKGYELALKGPLALLELNVAWLANPFYLLSLGLMLGCLWRAAAVTAALAALLGLHTLQFYTHTLNADYMNMGRESPMLLAGLEPGFYLWMASFGLVLIVSLYSLLRERKLKT